MMKRSARSEKFKFAGYSARWLGQWSWTFHRVWSRYGSFTCSAAPCSQLCPSSLLYSGGPVKYKNWKCKGGCARALTISKTRRRIIYSRTPWVRSRQSSTLELLFYVSLISLSSPPASFGSCPCKQTRISKRTWLWIIWCWVLQFGRSSTCSRFRWRPSFS